MERCSFLSVCATFSIDVFVSWADIYLEGWR
jgi:hypothetical protein